MLKFKLKEKEQIRNLLLDKRDCTSADYLKIATQRISNTILASEEFSKATSVGAYYSTGSEIPTQELISKMIELNKNVYLPRVTNDTEMVFGKISHTTKLRTSKFFAGTMEPDSQSETTKCMDIILVPAIAASYDGHRLGYGFGYYDRYLGKLAKNSNTTTTIVPLLEKQVTKRLPADMHDIKINTIVTEGRTIHCK